MVPLAKLRNTPQSANTTVRHRIHHSPLLAISWPHVLQSTHPIPTSRYIWILTSHQVLQVLPFLRDLPSNTICFSFLPWSHILRPFHPPLLQNPTNILGKYKSWTSSLCHFLQLPLISFHFQILPLAPCFKTPSRYVSPQHSYKTSKLWFCIFLYSRSEDKILNKWSVTLIMFARTTGTCWSEEYVTNVCYVSAYVGLTTLTEISL
jgi:hypothetical protein